MCHKSVAWYATTRALWASWDAIRKGPQVSIFARILLEGSDGLSLEINSAEADHFNAFLKALVNNPNLDVAGHGYSLRLLDCFKEADVFLDSFSSIKHDDEMQYDAQENRLLAAGLAIEEGRRIPLPEVDPKLARLAEHIYMNYHEARATSAGNTKFHEARGSDKGKDIDRVHLSLTNGLMVALFLRLCMCVLQLRLRRKLNVLVPVRIGRDSGGELFVEADGELLDPAAYQSHVEGLLKELFDHLVV